MDRGNFTIFEAVVMDAGIPNRDLEEFNSRVLASQDQAYTLACYLFGDDRLAGEATQSAVMDLYLDRPGLPNLSFSVELFRRLVKRWRRDAGSMRRSAIPLTGNETEEDSLSRLLGMLSPGCQLAVVLVDCLGLGYPDAAYVSELKVSELQTCLARSRNFLSSRLLKTA